MTKSDDGSVNFSTEREPLPVFLAHDHLAQRGGAERVAQVLAESFGGVPIHTAVFAPERTYQSFANFDVKSMWFSAMPWIRQNHRWAFPLMAPGFSFLRSTSPVTFASSAGWSHGVSAPGRKVVYWFAPPRWLYQQTEYLQPGSAVARAVGALAPMLRVWDRRAVESIDRHIAVSTEVANRLRRIYDVEAEVLHPPMMLDADPTRIDGMPSEFLLVVSRLMSYKNIQHVVDAMRRMPDRHLIVVGHGPFGPDLRRVSPANVQFVEGISDGELVWLYQNCQALIAAAFEDFGLTPLEAAASGRPSVVLRAGGFLDSVEDGKTGVFFDTLATDHIVRAIETCLSQSWDPAILCKQAARFSRQEFVRQVQAIVEEEAAKAAETALVNR